MSESNFREIQLNTKQVVFLFMTVVVVLVGAFLLGVQVGQGVKSDGTTASASAADPPNDGPVPTVLPSPTTTKPGDLIYDQELRKKEDAKATAAAPPNPSADAPPDVTAKPTPTPAQTPAAAAPAAKPAPAPSKPAAEAAASPTAVWYVQIDSFSSKANADKRAAEVNAKNINAKVFKAPSGSVPYKVRVGPMERSAADTLRNRLQREGYTPQVIR